MNFSRFTAPEGVGSRASEWSLFLGRLGYRLLRQSYLLFVTVFLTTLSVYLITLAPGVVGGDAGEHQFAAPLLGIPHTTGYPLYILLGKLWTLIIPFGSMAWRMNLFSAVGGALAAGVTAVIVYYLIIPVTQPGLAVNERLAHKTSSLFAPSFPVGYLSIQSFAAAFIAGLTMAVGLTLWQWSVIAGVRSINILFFALLTLEAILWQRSLAERQQGRWMARHKKEIHAISNPPANLPTLYWLAFTVGLSLAHHRTTLFYLPSLIAWVGWHDPHLMRQPKRLLPLIFLSLAPLLLYLFIYFRGVNSPPYSHEQINNWSSFWFLVGSGDSSGLFFSLDPAFLPDRLAFIGRDLLTQLSWPGVILGVLGGVWLLWRQTRHFLFQALLVVLLLLFTLDFEVVNLNEAPTWYLMPAYFIFAVWVGLGVKVILGCLTDRRRFSFNNLRFGELMRSPTSEKNSPVSISWPQLTIQFFVILFIIALLGLTLGRPNWQTLYAASVAPLDEWRQLLRGRQAERFVESSLPWVEPNSIIWGDWEQYTPLKYYQLINGWRTDVTVRNPLDRWPEKVAAARAANQPIYFTRKLADLIGTPYLTMVGPLIYLQTAPHFEAPPQLVQLNANFENELELIGYRATIWPQSVRLPSLQVENVGERAGPILQLMLYWRVPKKVRWDYALSLRLLNPSGQEIYKRDAAHPVLSSYPTTLWTPGEVVGDFYEVPLPPNAGPFILHLLPYRTEGSGQWHNLRLNGLEPLEEGIQLTIQP